MFIKENKTIIMFLMNSTHVLSHNNNYNNITERQKIVFSVGFLEMLLLFNNIILSGYNQSNWLLVYTMFICTYSIR